MISPSEVLIRDADGGDIPLILSSWADSHERFTADHGYSLRYVASARTPLKLIARCPVTVACDPQDPDEAFGWICHERAPDGRLIVHYCFVKHVFRRMGIARLLWSHVNPNGEPAVHTHSGWAIPDIRERYKLTFDPYWSPTKV